MHTVSGSIVIDAPSHVCYEAWAKFESFPQIFSHVNSVTRQGENASGNPLYRWEISGPMGRTYAWTAATILNAEDKFITWSTDADEEIANSGTVNFMDTNESQTLLDAKLTYSAPAGPLGEFLADTLHLGDGLVGQALQEFKSYVERQTHGVAFAAEQGIAPNGKTVAVESGVMGSEAEVRNATESINRGPESPPVKPTGITESP